MSVESKHDYQPNTSRDGHVHILSKEEASELFDKTAQFHLKISGDEFLKRWDRGDYADDPEQANVVPVQMARLLVEKHR